MGLDGGPGIAPPQQLWENIMGSGGGEGGGIPNPPGASQDILVREGAKWAALAVGAPGQQLVVRSDGTLHYVTAPTISADAWGADPTGVADSTPAAEAAEAILGKGGGTITLSNGTYIFDGLKWKSGIKYKGVGSSINGTKIKGKTESTKNGIVEMEEGTVIGGAWEDIWFEEGVGNATREGLPPLDCFYLATKLKAGTAGVWHSVFKNLSIGAAAGWAGNCMWFRGGAVNSTEPHQYNTFENLALARKNTGTFAKTSRCIKLTGQCNKFEFDGACYASGVTPATKVGTNFEINREFIKTSTITAEAAAGVTSVEVASTAGLEANKIVELGEGPRGDVLTIEKIEGLKITFKTALVFTQVIGEAIKALSGTVAAPAVKAPALLEFIGGTYQNSELVALCDTALNVDFWNCDFEEQSKCVRIRTGSRQINLRGVKPNGASAGESKGTGTLTAGSAAVTGAQLTWANGDLINGAGITPGTTVLEGGGTANLTLSAVVTAAVGGAAIVGVPLVKGGDGGGYIAKYEKETQGTVSYEVSGAVDQTVIVDKEANVKVRDLSRGSSLASITSSGISIQKATAAELKVQSAAEIVLTNAATVIKYISGFHAAGETVTIRATVNATKFETGGNIGFPQASPLTLEAGESATFRRSDYSGAGATTWVLSGILRKTS